MTTASKITLVRVALIPFYMLLLLLHISTGTEWMRWAALAFFIVASVSDFLDGYIARHYNQVSANSWIRWQTSCSLRRHCSFSSSGAECPRGRL